jgi:hypothetical protein
MLQCALSRAQLCNLNKTLYKRYKESQGVNPWDHFLFVKILTTLCICFLPWASPVSAPIHAAAHFTPARQHILAGRRHSHQPKSGTVQKGILFVRELAKQQANDRMQEVKQGQDTQSKDKSSDPNHTDTSDRNLLRLARRAETWLAHIPLRARKLMFAADAAFFDKEKCRMEGQGGDGRPTSFWPGRHQVSHSFSGRSSRESVLNSFQRTGEKIYFLEKGSHAYSSMI